MELTLGVWRISVQQVKPTQAELVATYNEAAARWHRSVSRLGYPTAYRNLFTQLQSARLLAQLPEHGRVLDCGIGAGDLSLALAQNVTQSLQFNGLDISPHMLQQAEQLLRHAQVTPRLYCREVQQTGFEAESFDMVMSAHTLEHLDDPLVGLREMVRILRPGAPLVLVMTRRSWLSAWLQVKWHLQTVTSEVLGSWLKQAGLSQVQFYPLGGPPWCRQMSLAVVGFKPQ